MRITLKKIVDAAERFIAFKHYHKGDMPHNYDLIYKEAKRKYLWRDDVIYACDNRLEFFPIGQIPKYDWKDQRQVHMPKKWRVPKEVFEADRIQYICYHIIRHGKGLKVVRLKNVKPVTRITLRKGKE